MITTCKIASDGEQHQPEKDVDAALARQGVADGGTNVDDDSGVKANLAVPTQQTAPKSAAPTDKEPIEF